MAPVYPRPFQDSALEGRSRTPSEVLVIGRDFPGPRCTMHPVAQFNITYAYSIVSQRHRPESERGLCTPGSVLRPTRRTGRTKAGPARQFPPDSCRTSYTGANQVSSKSRSLTITPRFTAICRNTDFRPNSRHLPHSRLRNASAMRATDVSHGSPS